MCLISQNMFFATVKDQLKVVIPETYSIDQCADLPFPGA